ncbi:MAG: aldo/keto reductase [Steroidobacteraceae bacterium]
MEYRKLGKSVIGIAPIVFGGNVFGWTADKAMSFALLDAFLEAGFNAIDVADTYPSRVWCGVSEYLIGAWMNERRIRDKMVIITKCGCPVTKEKKGLQPDYMRRAIEESLNRLQTDYIDIYMSHLADPTVPIEDTLEAHQSFIDQGKSRICGFSNYTAAQMREALEAAGNGRARYQVLEPHYNLNDRAKYEGEVEDVCVEYELGVIPYFSLEAGFLTGKYRSKHDLKGGYRDYLVQGHLESPRGQKVLHAMDKVAARHDATLAQVALAWLLHRPSVTAPIASATNVAQLSDILKAVDLSLTADDMAELDV